MPIPLPLDSAREEILAALAVNGSLVLSAPTGSGKSTRIPPMLLGEARGKVLVLEPRRLATRLVAARVAQEMGCPLGGPVGYQTRHEGRVGPDTRLLYLTQGLFLRMLLDDPRLDKVSALVLDEFHERHLDGDIALAMALRLRRTTRPDLAVVVMSATLDTETLSDYLDCPVVKTRGRAFPVEVRHIDAAEDRPPWEAAARAVREIVRAGESGDILVFMPGGYEIRRTVEAVRDLHLPEPLTAFPLHGEMPAEEQDRALAPATNRKVIVATNVAETSITIPGVRHVVDSGLARVARFDPRRGINMLTVQKISRASAEQRAGRAGRTEPGTCRRLWSLYDHQGRSEHETPEIGRVDLSQALLLLNALGVNDIGTFSWLIPPPDAAVRSARDLLASLGATAPDGDPADLDHRFPPPSGNLTELGRQMARVPAHPRLARLVLEGERRGCRDDAALVAALLSERTILRPGPRNPLAAASDDLSDLLARFSQAREHGFDDAFCQGRSLSASAARQVDRTWRQLRQTGQARHHRTARACTHGSADAGRPAGSASNRGLSPPFRSSLSPDPEPRTLPLCLLTAFPDHVAARSRPGSPVFNLTGGRRATLSRETLCTDCDLVLACEIAEIEGGSGLSTVLSLLVPLKPDDLLEMFCNRMGLSSELSWNRETQVVEQIESTRFFDLAIEETRGIPTDRTAAAALLARRIVAEGLHLSGFDDRVEAWVERLRFVATTFPEKGLPVFDDADRQRAIEALCGEDYRYAKVKDRPALEAVRSLLSPAHRRFVDEMAPERIQLPRGHRIRVSYPQGQRPTGRARIQDLYDLPSTPRIAGGRVPLLLEIAGPNNRPLQVTDDLANFWKVLYPQLRAQLQRRYPRHEWR
ncbi:MAG: ATP-dependent helicase HrpB [Deltaproteobacteria bacterium]|nr:ATP-dependent helicase HrpB [Deltaproteobacteria bacterium]